jgi:hypothetical protein
VQAAEYEAWTAAMQRWRLLKSIGYSGSEYERPELAWTRRNIVHTHMIVGDRHFYAPVARHYRRPLPRQVQSRYGGTDSVLVWPVYLNIGVDNWNRFDIIRDMPGGIPGSTNGARFQRRRLKVFFPVRPGTKGTRQEPLSAAKTAARLMKEIGADGLNGDTMSGLPDYRRISAVQMRCNLHVLITPEFPTGTIASSELQSMSQR